MNFTGTDVPAPAPMGAGGGAVVSLSKGERVSLSKVAPTLRKMIIGLGWDTNRYDGGYPFDLDVSCFMCGEDGRCDPRNFIFYNNLSDAAGSVVHMGDNLTGDGDGDDEQIKVDLDKVPTNIKKIAITVTIHEAEARGQMFGQVENAYIRLVNEETGAETIRYDLTEDYSTETALVIAELYEKDGWKFNAVGAGFDSSRYSSGLQALCANYGINAE